MPGPSHLQVAIPIKKVTSQLSSLVCQSLTQPASATVIKDSKDLLLTHIKLIRLIVTKTSHRFPLSTSGCKSERTSTSSPCDKQLQMGWEPQHFPEASVYRAAVNQQT